MQSRVEPAKLAETLSRLKAECVAKCRANATIIGADTIVALENDIYGKPVDVDDARRILGILLHHPHEVITGFTVLDSDSGHCETHHAVTVVTMSPMPPDKLEAYLASGLWRNKAGAYGIQDHGDEFVRRLEGSFSNVVGLPMELLKPVLLRWGYKTSVRHRRR